MSEIFSELEPEAAQLGDNAIKAVEADLPTWATELKNKLEAGIEELAAHHATVDHLLADLRKAGIPVPAVTEHYAATGTPLPDPTPDAAPAAPAAETIAV